MTVINERGGWRVRSRWLSSFRVGTLDVQGWNYLLNEVAVFSEFSIAGIALPSLAYFVDK